MVAAALFVITLAAAVQLRQQEDNPTVASQGPLLPPAVSGEVAAVVATGPCKGDCVFAFHTFRAEDPATRTPERAVPADRLEVLADGRYFEADVATRSSTFTDVAAGIQRVVPGWVASADVLPGGDVVMISKGDARDAPRGVAVRVLDPHTGDVTTLAVPGDHLPLALAVGPGGTLAVLGDAGGKCCLDDPELVLIRPGRSAERRALPRHLDQPEPLLNADVEISWGPKGLLAVSGDRPTATIDREAGDLQRFGWTVIIDPETGDTVRSLPGWEGLAWSPDGRGILLARRTDVRTSELTVFWGATFSERIRVGTTDLPVLPMHWTP